MNKFYCQIIKKTGRKMCSFEHRRFNGVTNFHFYLDTVYNPVTDAESNDPILLRTHCRLCRHGMSNGH
jgi:hypothetical protein